MSELVLLHHNEPMTTSLAIAEGVEMEHKSVIQLIRKYVSSLQEFGRVAFEIEPFDTAGGIQTREVAFLNEPQATLLITFLRNSEIVVRFKVALVKAFFEMRDRLRGSVPQFTTRQLDHGADLAVAADRTFRSFLRSARSAGLRLPEALRQANRQTVARTGVDMLAELGVQAETAGLPSKAADAPETFLDQWMRDDLPIPYGIVKTTDLYDAYCLWFGQHGGRDPVSPQRFFYSAKTPEFGLLKTTLDAGSPGDRWTVRVIMPRGAFSDRGELSKQAFSAQSIKQFAEALAIWRVEVTA
jgi:phage regulator Rha-like protein